MTTSRFSDLLDLDTLARATGVGLAKIESYARSNIQAEAYQLLKIPKRGRRRAGQFRLVYKARQQWLADLHRAVALMVTAATPLGAHVQGFVQGRSIRSNAQQHLGARWVLHGDIEGFFDAITTAQVQRGFVALGAAPEVADCLARACTIDGLLRQGTRCAPAVANLVCRSLDMDLLALAEAHRCIYTRYADDLTFSGEEVPRSEAVQAVLQQHGFKLRDGHCHVQRRGRAQFVTGLHVGDALQARLPRRLKRRLRLVLHFVEKFGVDAHFAQAPRGRAAGIQEALGLAGMLRYVKSIEPDLAKKLMQQYRVGSQKSFQLRSAFNHDESN
jgi:hypothetical protein